MDKSTKVKTRTNHKNSHKNQSKNINKYVGSAILLITVYLFVCCISYGFTWQNDQDLVFNRGWEILLDNNATVNNWFGRLGALLSHLLIYWGFGVGTIYILLLMMALGITIYDNKSIFTCIFHNQGYLVAMVFSSIFLSFLFQNNPFPWGGDFGNTMTVWLMNLLGSIGLGLIIVGVFIIYIITKFDINLGQLAISGFPNQGYNPLDSIGDKVNHWIHIKSSTAKNTSPAHVSVEQSNPTETATTDNHIVPSQNNQEVPLFFHQSNVGSTDESIENDVDEEDIDIFELNDREEIEDDIFISNSDSIDFKINNNTEIQPLSNNIQRTKGLKPDVLKDEFNLEDINFISQADVTSPYDPTLDLSMYKKPSIDLLSNYHNDKISIDRSELNANKDQIVETLLNYKIEINTISATVGPTVTLYEIVPSPGVKISKIKNLEDDIALSLSALGIRIIAPMPGKGTIGIEVPNKSAQIVGLKEMLKSDKFQNTKMELPVALGRTISNEIYIADLSKMPHLLIAGATGQGKSVGINTVIMSLLYHKHPSEVKIVMVDPKKVELFPYSSLLKHFLAQIPDTDEPIITETSKVINTIKSMCVEMDNRYELLKQARVRNVKDYNTKFINRQLNPQNGHRYLPFLVLIIDEFADLIMTAGKDIEIPIARLAQLARAIGIHLVIATQRPSVNIITGIIKANFPARLAFKVTSKIDSRTILDTGGAEQLIGRGDMLLSLDGNITRLQCAFVDTPEVEEVLAHISNQQGYPEPYLLPEVNEDGESSNKSVRIEDLDEMIVEAGAMVIQTQSGSTSMLQRKLQLGFNRAGRLMDQLEALGVVGATNGSKPREVYFSSDTEFMEMLESFKRR